MKTRLLFLWLSCLALGAMAQTEKTLILKKVEKGQEPQAVMAAVKSDFPDAIMKDLAFLPAKLYGQEWNLLVEGDEDVNATLYQMQITQGDRFYTAVYDKDGKLLSSKQTVTNAELPKEVLESVQKFSGWKLNETQEIIKSNGKKATLSYKVKLQKGTQYKSVFLDPKGTILHQTNTI